MNFFKWFWPSKKTETIQPNGDVLRFFHVLEYFVDPKTKSQYIEGQKYTVRKGNKALDEKVKYWAAGGKVKIEEIE
ncbi:MAG: hypothetical protein L3J58_11805 [Emcibacter sp.]|nr:hypothetical protein [Emcibacter sp.]